MLENITLCRVRVKVKKSFLCFGDNGKTHSSLLVCIFEIYFGLRVGLGECN